MATIKTDELLNRISRQGARSACEVCGINNWVVVGEKTAQVVTLSLQDQPTAGLVVGGQSIPAFLNVCGNCGNVRFHAVGVLAPELMKSDG